MLRRTKTIVFNDDPEPDVEAIEARPRPSLRRNLEALRNASLRQPEAANEDEPEAPAANPVHARFEQVRSEFENEPISRGSQESLAALREEFRRKHVTEDEPSGVSLPSFSLGGLKPSRLILVIVAIIAGGLAAWLALGRAPEPKPEPTAIEAPAPPPVPTLDVLVAKTAIPVGRRLTGDMLEWQKWPEETVRSHHITSEATPEAISDLSGSVARLEIVAGEPVLREKLGQAGNGYLSAILEPGKRAVAVSVDARSASGGFIAPNDHVDVVLTSAAGSRTILANVRVLAIGSRLGGTQEEAETADPAESVFSSALATLELDPVQAELIIDASGGNLSLVLRPMSDSSERTFTPAEAINQSIRITSPFWVGSPTTAATGTEATY